jgi:hypothetical protein
MAKKKSSSQPHGPSIKKPKVYDALRAEGMSKSSAAAISNADAARGRSKKSIRSSKRKA